MNKYLRAAVVVPVGAIKMCCTKVLHRGNFDGPLVCMISPHTEITVDKGAKLFIGKMFKMRDGSKLRVRKNAVCHIGNNTAFGSNNVIVCHERIEIGDNVQLSPNVQIYDHDHDFRHPDGLASLHYKTAPVVIGNNVWIGANTVILRGTTIGDNCVVGAGSVVKGDYPAGTVIIQKRTTEIYRGGYTVKT